MPRRNPYLGFMQGATDHHPTDCHVAPAAAAAAARLRRGRRRLGCLPGTVPTCVPVIVREGWENKVPTLARAIKQRVTRRFD